MPAGSTAAANLTKGNWGCTILSGEAIFTKQYKFQKTPLLCFQDGCFSHLFCEEFQLDLHGSGNFYILQIDLHGVGIKII